MKYSATILSRGRLTIPAGLRRELGLRAGDTVVVTMKGGSLYLRRVPKNPRG